MTLVTPTKKLLVGEEVEEVLVPADRGELNILPGHAGLITSLSPGVLKYRKKGSGVFAYAAISWGYCEIFNDQLSILAETAELPNEIEVDRVKATLARANENLSKSDVSTQDIEKFSLKIKRAEARLEVAEHKFLEQ